MINWEGLLPFTRSLRMRKSLILAYHGVGDSTMEKDPEFLQVAPQAFRAQVGTLVRAGFEVVTVEEFGRRAGGTTPPPGLVALAFDDGMRDNYDTVLPILQEFRVPATVYVTTGMIGRPNPWLHVGDERMMTEDEIVELSRAGIEIGAHTVTHPSLEALDYETCLAEMTESRDALATIIGKPITTFAYPYCHYGPEAMLAARDAGFEVALTCHGRGSWEPLEMKRVMITGKDGPASFALKLAELYGPIFTSPAGQHVRTLTRSARRRTREWVERQER